MEGRLLLSPVGFVKWKVVEPAKLVAPSRLVLVHTDHRNALRNVFDARSELRAKIPHIEDIQVVHAFDFVEWYRTFEGVVREAHEEEIVVNLTSSHGVAVSMAAMVAARRSLPCVCFDNEGTGLHHVSPAIIFHLEELEPSEKALLRALAKKELGVTEAAKQARIGELSTASVALKRLHDRGFLGRRKAGRTVTYELRGGVREFLGTITK